MEQFISKEILDKLSYHSALGKSLKNISLRKTPIEEILDDIGEYRDIYFDMMAVHPEIFDLAGLIQYRFKSDQSLMVKYEKTLRENKGFKQCFNDVLGFRLHLEEYPETFPQHFRVVDMRQGKKQDDGYRAIHLYYQRDNYSYPLEVQLWCGDDYLFNLWSHKYIYKYKSQTLGCRLYEEFTAHNIPNEQIFYNRLLYWEEKLNDQ